MAPRHRFRQQGVLSAAAKGRQPTKYRADIHAHGRRDARCQLPIYDCLGCLLTRDPEEHLIDDATVRISFACHSSVLPRI